MNEWLEDFHGVIGRTLADSQPWWPEPAVPAPQAPHVVLVVLDDVGFAHLNCYGSTIETPNIDRLAAGGLQFVNFHTTSLCSPSRACLLTGRNHHAVGMRAISNFDTGFPHMRGAITPHAATLAELLRDQGYGCYMVGKWHLAPMHETGPAGPFRNWPLGRGFDRFYGFLQGETDQFQPELVEDNHYTVPPRSPEQGYHLSEDLVDRAIACAKDHVSTALQRPFFTYLAFGACHAPHQAPQAYLDKYRGRFDDGWDVARERWFERQKQMGVVPAHTTLPPRNPGVPAWSSLTPDERLLAARLQEAFAAFLDHTDAQVGRYVEALRAMGQLDNTLFVLLSDNGASQEGGVRGTLDGMRYYNGLQEPLADALGRVESIGGPDSHCNYPLGWAMAGNTPLRRYKQDTYAGGVRDPLIVHWPARIHDAGGIRRQFHHVVDIAPTVLDLLGIEVPATWRGVPQMPVHGVSMAYAFDRDAARVPTRKSVQYFEMFGHRAIWHDGWKAVCDHRAGGDYDQERWELFHLDEDVSEAHDLALQAPERLEAMVALWWEEARRHGVLPLDDRRGVELFKAAQSRAGHAARRQFVFYPPVSRLSAEAAPPTGSRSFVIRAQVVLAPDTQGAILARGGLNGGYALFVQGGRLVFHYNHFHQHSRVVSSVALPCSEQSVGVRVDRDGKAARATLFVGEQDLGSVNIPEMASIVSSTGMDVGRSMFPVCDAYQAPFAFSGELRRVSVDIAASNRSQRQRDALIAEQVTASTQ